MVAPNIRLSQRSGSSTAHFAPINPPRKNPRQIKAATLRFTYPS